MKKIMMFLTLLVLTAPAFSAGYQWTQWLDRDNPSGTGDWENLNAFLANGQACEFPQAIKCKTLDGQDYHSTGQTYTCDVTIGGICKNNEQATGETCLDYKVKFLCPR